MEGQLRLLPTVSISSANSGRLELCRNDSFGTIRTESRTSFWSEKNMLVACRRLGFAGALNTIPPIQYEQIKVFLQYLITINYA